MSERSVWRGPIASDLDHTQAYLSRAKDAVALARTAPDLATAEALNKISLAWVDLAKKSGGEVVERLFQSVASNDRDIV